jgi:hypothetical protein
MTLAEFFLCDASVLITFRAEHSKEELMSFHSTISLIDFGVVTSKNKINSENKYSLKWAYLNFLQM